jgi:hypothetical protein
MTQSGIQRTEYWNLSQPGTVRAGATGHGESLTDMENYLLPMDQARGSGLFSWGVADGLAVQASTGAAGVTIAPGTALDAAGRLIVLAAGGTAITDPAIDPAQVQGVPTVPVTDSGVTLDTANAGADCLLTLTWHEVAGQSTLGGAPTLLHAPWLRLVPAAGFADTGGDVVLAEVTMDGTGNVTGLSAGLRRLVGIPAGPLVLRIPRAASGAGGSHPSVDQQAAARLSADDGGGLVVTLLTGAAPQAALSIDGQTGQVTVPGTVSAAGALRVTSAQGHAYQTSSGPDGWHFTDATAGADRFVVSQDGNVGVGVGPAQTARTVHVEGGEVHSGGGSGGFSFTDRQVGSFVNVPPNGERWVWYALAGTAHLWSEFDRISVSATGEGGGLDVGRRMRVRQASDSSAGIWFFQSTPAADRAFVGMADDTHVGFWGNTGAGWGLRMDTGTGAVGINTASPSSQLDVSGPGIAISGRGGNGPFQAGVFGSGTIGVWGQGSGTGIVASGNSSAGSFFGPVSIFGDLDVRGTLSKGGGGFRIDHPLDPAHKFLSHSFVESPEMLNIYAGAAVTDDQGTATVSLPGYFQALNRDHHVQLTPVGQLALATVEGGIRDNQFVIRTDRPGVTVAWQVTGVRQDPWAEAHRIVAEQDKGPHEDGMFLHSEELGQPESASLANLAAYPGVPGSREGDET